MKNKVIALTLSAVLALSSTSAFAAENTNCTKVNFDYSSLVKSISSNYKIDCTNILNKLSINGQSLNCNSIKWNIINCKTADCKTANLTKADCKTTDCKSAKCTTADCKTAIKTAKPAAVKPAVKQPAISQPAATKPVVKQPTVAKPVATKPVSNKPAATYEPIKNSTSNDSSSNKTVSSSNLNYEQKVVELVNIERQKNGLSPLTLDSKISNVARTKSKDMATNNYFAHQSPTYGSAGNMLKNSGINWSAWGENIASGQRTPEAVVTAWMNSEGHRANILSSNFSKIGVGYAVNSNGTPYWTQMFTN